MFSAYLNTESNQYSPDASSWKRVISPDGEGVPTSSVEEACELVEAGFNYLKGEHMDDGKSSENGSKNNWIC